MPVTKVPRNQAGIYKGTHIKEERVVHRKRKLHMSQVSWTVVEVLIAG